VPNRPNVNIVMLKGAICAMFSQLAEPTSLDPQHEQQRTQWHVVTSTCLSPQRAALY
jgi:hypothetical protein